MPVKTSAAERRHGPRSTENSISSPSWASLDISWWCTTSSSSAAVTTSTARAGGARRTLRCVTRWVSPPPMRSHWGCSSSDFSHRIATAHPISTSISNPVVVKRSSSTCTAGTAGTTPPRWRTSSPTGCGLQCAIPRELLATPRARPTPGHDMSTDGRVTPPSTGCPNRCCPPPRACWMRPGIWECTPGAW